MSAQPVLAIRHAESVWNAQKRWQGRADPSLSNLGERQVAAFVEGNQAFLRRYPVVWSSELSRARRTADIIADRTGARRRVDPQWSEIDAGEWEGLTRSEIDRRWPEWVESGQRPMTFEPIGQVRERVTSALAEIDPGALVVTHSGVLCFIASMFGHQGFTPTNLSGMFIFPDRAEFFGIVRTATGLNSRT